MASMTAARRAGGMQGRPAAAMATSPHVLVVGAGIIGASIAWHLRAAGARVTVVEAGAGGGVATPNSFAWINASWGNPEPYFRLRIRAMAEWRWLAAAVPAIPLAWTGGLCWDLPPARLEAYAREHGAWATASAASTAPKPHGSSRTSPSRRISRCTWRRKGRWSRALPRRPCWRMPNASGPASRCTPPSPRLLGRTARSSG